MRYLKQFFIIYVVGFASITGPAVADEFEELAIVFLHESGALDEGITALHQAFAQQRGVLIEQIGQAVKMSGKDPKPAMVEDFVDVFISRITTDLEINLSNLMIVQLRKVFTLEEIKTLAHDSESPAALLLLPKMDGMEKEAEKAGRAYGMELGQKVMMELMQSHPLFK